MIATVLDLVDLRDGGDVATVLPRPDEGDAPIAEVRDIISSVRARGDAALRELTERFDGVLVDELRVPAADVAAAPTRVGASLREALEYAAGEIRAYHEAQRDVPVDMTRAGVRLHERVIPVERAGAYVPGGRATYPSTVLMTVIPARVAGVEQVVVCVPPGPDGQVPTVTLAAAAIAGADAVYRVGGAQAIAALAYGTETVPAVDVIVGPGNAYVTAAKREVAGRVGIDGLAGPSEVVVVADGAADPDLVAADLLAQAEHGPGGSAVLVTWVPAVVDAVDAALARRRDEAPRRAEIDATITTGGYAVLVADADQAVAVVNELAPEHVELMVDAPGTLADQVRNAGAVFCGPWSPAAVGDYVAGVNHVLPTARTARFASALRADDFRKRTHVVWFDEQALARVAPHIEALARAEGLEEHARAVELRGTDDAAREPAP